MSRTSATRVRKRQPRPPIEASRDNTLSRSTRPIISTHYSPQQAIHGPPTPIALDQNCDRRSVQVSERLRGSTPPQIYRGPLNGACRPGIVFHKAVPIVIINRSKLQWSCVAKHLRSRIGLVRPGPPMSIRIIILMWPCHNSDRLWSTRAVKFSVSRSDFFSFSLLSFSLS
jgi:hypothetical protein